MRASATIALAIAAVFAVASSAEAATPANVQNRATEITSGTVANLPFAQPNTAGDLVVVYVAWDNSSQVTISDSAGNAYASAAPAVSLPLETASTDPASWNNGAWSSQVFYASDVAGGANTVHATFHGAISSFADVYIHEYSGVDPVSSLDASSTTTGTGAAMDSGSATTTVPGDLIFGAGASTDTVTAAGSGFKTRSTRSGNRVEDKIVTSAGSYSATATQNGSAWVMHAVAFKGGRAAGHHAADRLDHRASAERHRERDRPDHRRRERRHRPRPVSVPGRRSGRSDRLDPPYGLSWDTREVANGAHTLARGPATPPAT